MMVVKFFTVVKEKLMERLQLVKQGITPPKSDMRNFWYACRLAFLTKHPEFLEVDSKAENPYQGYEAVIIEWCITHSDDPVRWWRLRDILNIHAGLRAISLDSQGTSIVDFKSRKIIGQNCSFILLCEKATVSEELFNSLSKEGYSLKLISTGGKGCADVKEAIINCVSEEENFFILSLHDYDLDGIEIYFDLKKHYPNLLDAGINRDFLESLPNQDAPIKEPNVHRKYHHKLETQMQNIMGEHYDNEDFLFLQGEQIATKKWRGQRIEIDSIHASFGIQPFIDYIKHILETKCKCWDLTNIGIGDYSLDEPSSQYNEKITNLEDRVSRKYSYKLHQLSKNYNLILELITEAIPRPQEFDDLRNKHLSSEVERVYRVSSSNIKDPWKLEIREIINENYKALLKKYESNINYYWSDDYEEEVDKFNDALTCWEGDLSTAKEDVEDGFEEIQDRLNDAFKEDPEYPKFKQELEDIDYDLDELEEIESETLRNELETVITHLQNYLDQLDQSIKD